LAARCVVGAVAGRVVVLSSALARTGKARHVPIKTILRRHRFKVDSRC
jgi:hypothetical protein